MANIIAFYILRFLDIFIFIMHKSMYIFMISKNDAMRPCRPLIGSIF